MQTCTLLQRENSPSGTTGYVVMNVAGLRGQLKVNFDCPYIGSNKCNLSGSIPGLKFTRLFFSGSRGSKAVCLMKIENA